MEPKHSPLGIASFAMSLGVGVLLLITFIIAGVLNAGRVEHGRHYPGQALVGLAVIGLLAVDVGACALGIAAICQQGKKRLFGILGLVISAIILAGTVALIALGLYIASKAVR